MIRKKGNEFYLSDLGSTNGTKLNNRKLISKEESCLRDNDEISLSNEKFVFYK